MTKDDMRGLQGVIGLVAVGIVAVLGLLLGGCKTMPTDVDPLVKENCPPLPERDVSDFGKVALVAIEDAQQYNLCRRAALRIKD